MEPIQCTLVSYIQFRILLHMEKKYFTERQENRRKEVERAFGSLHGKFYVVALP